MLKVGVFKVSTFLEFSVIRTQDEKKAPKKKVKIGRKLPDVVHKFNYTSKAGLYIQKALGMQQPILFFFCLFCPEYSAYPSIISKPWKLVLCLKFIDKKGLLPALYLLVCLLSTTNITRQVESD